MVYRPISSAWNPFLGKACPDGMFLLYGKCVSVVKNTISDTADSQNCRWKSNSKSYDLASIGNTEVKFSETYNIFQCKIHL